MKVQDKYPKFLNRWNGRFYRALITKDFVFFVNFQEGDENGCCEMYNRDMELISNNYFAHVGLSEELAKGKDNWEYISPTMKQNYKLAEEQGYFEEWNAI